MTQKRTNKKASTRNILITALVIALIAGGLVFTIIYRKNNQPILDKIRDDKKIVVAMEGTWLPYPFPSIALGDTRGKPHAEKNCWGYYSQALTALRGQLWMDRYGRSADYDALLEKWVDVYASQDEILFSQEIDPYTGRPTDCSRWYSSAMLTYLYAVKRLGLL